MLFLAFSCLAATAPDLERNWLPVDPGPALTGLNTSRRVIGNRSLRLSVDATGRSVTFENLLGHQAPLTLDPPILAGGGFAIKFQHPVTSTIERVQPDLGSTVAAQRLPGYRIKLVDTGTGSGYEMEWTWELRDGSNYVREELRIERKSGSADDGTASRIDLLNFDSRSARIVGSVPGSPVVDGNTFAGVEYPMAVNQLSAGHVRCSVERKVAIALGHPVQYSAVIGVAPDGQMRRAFGRYVERERAHPYRPFLHYNSWYDLGYFTPYTSDQCVERINTFGTELSVKRNAKLSSFLFDDGWDNTSGVWSYSKDFPDGFLPLKAAAAKYGAGPGVWLSPWGGYGQPHDTRVAAGKAQGYETGPEGFSLGGPKYYERFRKVTLDFVTTQGINQFKFDGTGSPDVQYPGSAFDSDFGAAISLIADLRRAKPDLFINLTTGTWPSPFWLQIADSTWRGGYDHSFAGVGTSRQQWMTYRDGDTYNGVVRRGPLYPINSLMLHGVIFAEHADRLNTDPGADFKTDVRAYFSTGTQLQELYITPKLLSDANWDDLAEAARWAADNASTLVDAHWVGGDPARLEVYGHAAWAGGKGILELRNPSDHPQAYAIDVARELEIPAAIKGIFRARSPWREDKDMAPLEFSLGSSRVVVLKPFEVLVLEGEVGR